MDDNCQRNRCIKANACRLIQTKQSAKTQKYRKSEGRQISKERRELQRIQRTVLKVQMHKETSVCGNEDAAAN